MDTIFTQESELPTLSRKSLTGTRNPLFTEKLVEKVDSLELNTALDLARSIALYIKILGNDGVVNCVSQMYVDLYDGKRFYSRFNKWFDMIYELFERNKFNDSDKRKILKKVAQNSFSIPRKVGHMKFLVQKIIFESSELNKMKRKFESRKHLLDRFKTSVKKYLNLTYELGYNEPSLCAMTLAKTHKIDKYILSGDFPVMLLPFLPDLEESIQLNYEKYEMQDSWQMIKERYFNQKDKFMTLAIEIKSVFVKNIPNFSDYFDKIYTDTYYKMMLSRKR